MEKLAIVAGIIGVLVDIPLIIGIVKGNIKQNFLTYFLWGLLDLIALVTIMLQGGNFWLPLGYSIGALTVSLVLVFHCSFYWTKTETFVSILVIMCLIVWYFIGDRAGTIASVLALTVASIPQIVSTYRDPSTTPIWLYSVFIFAGVLSFLGSNNWNIENKLYPAGAIIISSTIVFFPIRRYILLNKKLN